VRCLGGEECLGGVDDLNAGDLVALSDGVHDLLILVTVDGAEDGVLAVKPWRGDMGDEELATVRSGSRIGHREEAWAVVLEAGSKLIGEFVSGTSHSSAGRIAALDHKIGDHAVEGDAVVETAVSEIEVVCHGDRCLAGIQGRVDITLGSMKDNADVLDGFGRVGGSGDAGGHAEGGG